jgi:hypothetical protein
LSVARSAALIDANVVLWGGLLARDILLLR